MRSGIAGKRKSATGNPKIDSSHGKQAIVPQCGYESTKGRYSAWKAGFASINFKSYAKSYEGSSLVASVV